MRQIQIDGSDIDLFHVANKYLGDYKQWWRIAQLNNMIDVLIQGTPQTILIPDTSDNSDYSLPSQ